jgi:Family of unknown function (DUF6427)
MLSFFKVNANYHWISLVVLLGLMRLPFLFHPLPLLIPELQWMLVGEKMAQGFMIYRDIWDSLSPLSAIIYWFIDSIFGRSQPAYQIIAAVLTIFQALYFNYLGQQRQFFSERNYVPAFLYILFVNISFDFSTLSPALMSTTFLLLALGGLTKQMQREGITEDVFEIGFYLSIAALFYIPSAIFIVWLFFVLLIYTGANIRLHALAIFGFAFPIALTVIYFFYQDALDALSRNLLFSVFQSRQYNLNSFQSVIITLFIPILIGVLGFFRTIAFGRFTNYQTRIQQIMMLWFMAGVLTIALMPYIAPMQFVLLVPPLVFFTNNFFLLSKRRIWLSELLALGIVTVILILQYRGVTNSEPGWTVARLDNLRTKTAPLPIEIKNQRILVIGNDEGEYRDNFPATPYLNWDLAQYDLDNPENYQSVISIYDNFTADPPKYVIDKTNTMTKIFKHIPKLANRYRPTTTKGIYVLK